MLKIKREKFSKKKHFKAVVIGGSAGATEVLKEILPLLPSPYPLPLFVVIHLRSDSENFLVDSFKKKCSIPVQEIIDKETICPNRIYFASPAYHMQIEREKTTSLSVDDPVHFSRPSIDVLFETAARAYGEDLVGILLSGANRDGAKGLKMIHDRGGWSIAQAPETALFPVMPKAAIDLFSVDSLLTEEEILSFLLELA